MNAEYRPAAVPREPVLNPVDRVSELLFGLFMALTFVGAVSVTEAGRDDIRAMLAAALGCNLAWGLVDAVMYLVRTVTDRGRLITLILSVRAAPDAETGRKLIEGSLSKVAANLLLEPEIEAVRRRIVALTSVPERPKLNSDDFVAALAVLLLVVGSTFPVVLPFVVFDDVGRNRARIAERLVVGEQDPDHGHASSLTSMWVPLRGSRAATRKPPAGPGPVPASRRLWPRVRACRPGRARRPGPRPGRPGAWPGRGRCRSRRSAARRGRSRARPRRWPGRRAGWRW